MVHRLCTLVELERKNIVVQFAEKLVGEPQSYKLASEEVEKMKAVMRIVLLEVLVLAVVVVELDRRY